MTAPVRTLVQLALFSAVALAATVAVLPAHAGDSMSPDRSMRMYRDPDTGAVGRPSAAALRAEAAAAPAPASAATLTEEPVGVPAGGMKVNLRGAHRPAVVRRLGASGPVHECVDRVEAGGE